MQIIFLPFLQLVEYFCGRNENLTQLKQTQDECGIYHQSVMT